MDAAKDCSGNKPLEGGKMSVRGYTAGLCWASTLAWDPASRPLSKEGCIYEALAQDLCRSMWLSALMREMVVLAAQLLCWSGQFIGHGVFEGRAPALLDNLSQAFLMAPFFVLLEVLHRLFSYEPYPGFHASVQAKIEAEQKEWQASKQKKSS